MHLLLGHRQIAGPNILQRVKLYLLESDNLPVHAHISVAGPRQLNRPLVDLLQHLHLRVIDRVRKVIAIDAPHKSLALFIVEFLDLILPRLVQINRLLMQSNQRDRERNLRNHGIVLRNVDHDKVVARNGAQADGVGWIAVARPVPRFRRMIYQTKIGQKLTQLSGVVRAKFLAFFHGQFKSRALQMIDQNLCIVRVDRRPLRRLSKKIFRVLDDELVERCRARHHHGQRRVLTAARAARSLPGRGNRTGIAGKDNRIERTNVHPQFQRIRRHHSAYVPRTQLGFNLPPLLRQVAATIPADHALRGRPLLDRILQIGDQNFGSQPVIGEHERLLTALDRLDRDPPAFVQIAAANPQLPVHHRRVVHHKKLLARRRAIHIHQRKRLGADLLGQLLRIRNRRRTADVLWLRSIKLTQPAQAAKDIRQMTAINAAIVMQLVHDNVLQVLEQLCPLRMVRQYA